MHQLFCNEDIELQKLFDKWHSSGITRIEMRFERRSFASVEYYTQQLERFYTTFVSSMAMEIRSVKDDLMQVVAKVNDCLLFIDET